MHIPIRIIESCGDTKWKCPAPHIFTGKSKDLSELWYFLEIVIHMSDIKMSEYQSYFVIFILIVITSRPPL